MLSSCCVINQHSLTIEKFIEKATQQIVYIRYPFMIAFALLLVCHHPLLKIKQFEPRNVAVPNMRVPRSKLIERQEAFA